MAAPIAASAGSESTDENVSKSGPALSADSLKHFFWMIRPCDAYEMEYKECKSMRGRWHQYFVHGSVYDCTDWNKDYRQCMQYRDTDDLLAAEETIRRELYRMKARKNLGDGNDVWLPRNRPPADWNAPLPEWKKRQHGLDSAKS